MRKNYFDRQKIVPKMAITKILVDEYLSLSSATPLECDASFTLAHFYCAFSATQKIYLCKWTLFDAFAASRRMCRKPDMPDFPLGKCV